MDGAGARFHKRTQPNRSFFVETRLALDCWRSWVRRFDWRRCYPKIAGAIGAILVVLRDFLLALRAGRMQIAFAVGAKVETSADRLSALRAGVGKRLAHQEVENKADRKISRRKHDHKKSPQRGTHAAAFRVAVHVGGHEDPARKEKRDHGDESGQRQ